MCRAKTVVRKESSRRGTRASAEGRRVGESARVEGLVLELPGEPLVRAVAWPCWPLAPSPMLLPSTGGRNPSTASPAPHAWP